MQKTVVKITVRKVSDIAPALEFNWPRLQTQGEQDIEIIIEVRPNAKKVSRLR